MYALLQCRGGTKATEADRTISLSLPLPLPLSLPLLHVQAILPLCDAIASATGPAPGQSVTEASQPLTAELRAAAMRVAQEYEARGFVALALAVRDLEEDEVVRLFLRMDTCACVSVPARG